MKKLFSLILLSLIMPMVAMDQDLKQQLTILKKKIDKKDYQTAEQYLSKFESIKKESDIKQAIFDDHAFIKFLEKEQEKIQSKAMGKKSNSYQMLNDYYAALYELADAFKDELREKNYEQGLYSVQQMELTQEMRQSGYLIKNIRNLLNANAFQILQLDNLLATDQEVEQARRKKIAEAESLWGKENSDAIDIYKKIINTSANMIKLY